MSGGVRVGEVRVGYKFGDAIQARYHELLVPRLACQPKRFEYLFVIRHLAALHELASVLYTFFELSSFAFFGSRNGVEGSHDMYH